MRKIILTLLLGALAGCETLPTPQTSEEAVEAAAAPVLPFEAPEPIERELDADLLFDFLVGEIGARQGEFQVAHQGYLEAALEASDAYAAERATLLALHIKDLDAALEGASLWAQFAPNSQDARKYLAVLLLRRDRFDEALAEFSAMRRIGDALGKDGRLQVATVLAGEPGRNAARKMLERVLADDSEAPEALYASALLDTTHGRFSEANETLVKALQAEPDWPVARILLSRVLVARKAPQMALEVLATGVQREPENKLLRKSYARLLVANGRHAQALDQFRELHDLSSGDVEVAYGYAMLATDQKAWDEARGIWQQLRDEPKYRTEAGYFLGQIEEHEGNDELALELYRSIDEGPLMTDAAIRAARLLQKAGDLDAARMLLREARAANPKRAIDLYLTEAQLMQSAESAVDAVLEVYAEALRYHPADNDLLYNRGLYLSEVGHYDRMEADFRAVLDKDPKDVNALNALGYMLAEQNIRLQEARGYIEQALSLKPELAAILDSMGWVLYRLGELEASLGYLKKAYEKDQDAEIAAHLIEVHWVLGDRDSAEELLRSAIRKDPDSRFLLPLRERLMTEFP